MNESMKYDYGVARGKRKWETEKMFVLKRLFFMVYAGCGWRVRLLLTGRGGGGGGGEVTASTWLSSFF
jgi:hypothetical protein